MPKPSRSVAPSPAEPSSDAVIEPIKDLSYEAARDELVQVVQQLETGTASLAQAMALWRRGEQLAAYCQRLLDQARAQVAAVLPDTTPVEPA